MTAIDDFVADMKETTKIEKRDIKRDEVSEISSSKFCVSVCLKLDVL